jgi:hypothetical protein
MPIHVHKQSMQSVQAMIQRKSRVTTAKTAANLGASAAHPCCKHLVKQSSLCPIYSAQMKYN